MRQTIGPVPVRYWWMAAAAAIALGMIVRLWGIATTPLWLDEAYSAYAAGKGFAFLWHVVPRYETHPPFYYTLLRLWSLVAGDGLVGLRALGLVAGLAGFAVTGWAARELARVAHAPARGTMLAALAIFAAHPFMVEMAREVRPYPLMILVYAGAVGALLRLRRQVRGGGGIGGRWYTLYLACLLAMLWLHNLGPLYATALGIGCLFVAFRRAMPARDWAWLAGGHAAVLLGWLPALLILLDQAPTWVRATWLTFNPSLLPVRVPMLFAGPGQIAALAALILAALGLARLGQAHGRTAAMLAVAACVPLMLSIALSIAIAPVFILRTMTPVAVPAILLMALGAATAPRRARGAALVVLAVLLEAMAGTDVANRRAGPPQDWYGAIRWLAPRIRPGDLVVAYPNEGALPFDRAVRDLGLAMPTRPIPSAIPSLTAPPGSWYVSGSRGVPSLDRPHLEGIANAPAMRAVPTVWLLRLGPWAYDKDDVLLDALMARRDPVGRFRAGPIDLIGLRRLE